MSAPDVREAAERVRAEREYRDKTAMCDNYTDHARSRQRESEAVEDLLRAALAAPVSPPAPHATDLAAMAKGIDEECCCIACGREVAPSPCCPDYPVWPGPCRSCYSDPTPAPSRPADDAGARATERVVKAWTRMDKPGAECDLHDAVEALYEAWTDAAERAAKGGDRG